MVEDGGRQRGFRASNGQMLPYCGAEQSSALRKGSFEQIVLVPRVRKPMGFLAFVLLHNVKLLSPVNYDVRHKGERES